MKWKRSNDHIAEYSTFSIGVRHYISIRHIEDDELFSYVYSKNGEEILKGYIRANGLDEAEYVILHRIRDDLSWEANRYSKLLKDFDVKVNANETLDR